MTGLILFTILILFGKYATYKIAHEIGYRKACRDHRILYGADAKRFNDSMGRVLPPEKIDEIKKSYELLKDCDKPEHIKSVSNFNDWLKENDLWDKDYEDK